MKMKMMNPYETTSDALTLMAKTSRRQKTEKKGEGSRAVQREGSPYNPTQCRKALAAAAAAPPN